MSKAARTYMDAKRTSECGEQLPRLRRQPGWQSRARDRITEYTFTMGKAIRLECSVPQSWPQQKFELAVGENFIEDFGALPENIRRKIRFHVNGGVLRVIGDRSALDSVEVQASSGDTAPAVPSGTRDPLAGLERSADALPPAPSGARLEPPADAAAPPSSEANERTAAANDVGAVPAVSSDADRASDRAVRFRRFFDGLGPSLVHSLRVSIILELMKQEGIGTSRLSRLLRRPRQTVSEHASALERMGILKYERKGRRYSVNLEWLERVDRLLAR